MEEVKVRKSCMNKSHDGIGIVLLIYLGQPRCFREERNFFTLLGFESWIVQPPQASHCIDYVSPAPEGKERNTP
jgi:hypothetical protein